MCGSGCLPQVQAAVRHGRRPGTALWAAVALPAQPQGAVLAPDPASRTPPPWQVQGVVSLWPRQYWVTDLDYLHTYVAQGERGGWWWCKGAAAPLHAHRPLLRTAAPLLAACQPRLVPALPPAMSPTTPLPASIRVQHQPPARTPTHCHHRLVNSPRVRSCPTLPHPPSRLTTPFPPCHACSAGRRPAHLQHHPQRNSGGRGEAPRLARLRQPHRRSEAAAGHSDCVHLPR